MTPLHLWIAHFPVALLLVGAAADLAGAALGRRALRRWAGGLLVLGGAAALLAFLTGQGALDAALPRLGVVGPGADRVELHARWGGAGVWVLAGASALRAAWHDRLDGPRGWLLVAATLLAALLALGITASGTGISHAG
jgi:uncharacterized membrane protein